MKRRILAFFLALVLVGTMLPTETWAVSGPAVACGSAEAIPGQEAVVDLTAENLPAVGSLSAELFYDSDALELVNIQQGHLLSGADQVSLNDQTPGAVRLKAISLDGISGSGLLLRLRFRVRTDCPAGRYTLSAAVGEVLGTDLAPVAVSTRHGAVTVKEQVPELEGFAVYLNTDSYRLQQGEQLTVQLRQRRAQSLSSGEFSISYDREHFRLVAAELGRGLLQEGAVHSINTATEGIVRVAYAASLPMKSTLLMSVQLEATADVDAVSALDGRAENVWLEPGRPYLPGTARTQVTLQKKQEADQKAALQLDTQHLIVGREAASVLALEKDSGLAAANFCLRYDPAVLACQAVSAAPEVKEHGGMVMINDNWKEGEIHFTYLNESAWSQADLPLLHITWKPLTSPRRHYQVIPSGQGVVDVSQRPVVLNYVTDTGCIYKQEEVKPTCTEEGGTRYRCGCGETYWEDPQPPLGHSYGNSPLICDRCGHRRSLRTLSVAAVPTKTTYRHRSEELDLTGGILRAVMEDGEELTVPMTEARVTAFDNRFLGQQTVTVELWQSSVSFTVEIVPDFRMEMHLEATAEENGAVMLRWTPPEGVDHLDRYQVYESFESGQLRQIGTTTDTSMEVKEEVATFHSYVVYGFWDRWPEEHYTSNTVEYYFQAASIKLQVSRSEATGKPYLQWTEVPGTEEYTVFYNTDGSFAFNGLYTTRGTHLKHGSAKPGQQYFYMVCAMRGDMSISDSGDAVRVVCACAMPQVTLSRRSDGKPVLQWDAIDGATGYEVYRSVNGGQFSRLTSVHSTRLTNGSAQAGNTYAYKVRALCQNRQGNSAFSAVVSANMEEMPLAAPSLSISNKSSTGKPYLKWTAVDGAEKYEVWRATSKTGSFSRLFTTSGTRLTNGSTTAGRTYYYKVRAIAADGTAGEFSEVKLRTCDCARPDVKLTTRNGHPRLTWQKVSGAVKYDVYCSVNGGSFRRLLTVKGTSLNHSSARKGSTYRYRVRAICSRSAGNSAWSYYDTIKVK